MRLPGQTNFVTITGVVPVPAGWRLFVEDDNGHIQRAEVARGEEGQVAILSADGAAEPRALLAGLWTEWMRAAAAEARSTALATTPLRPYAHQTNAVYGAMLPQPRLRFLLGDEPGTGKTIMAGMYLREMQRLGFLQRALVVAPAHLVSKWQADFKRFFGGGLRRIRASTVHEGALSLPHDLWIVSLELAAVNPAVQDAIHPDRAGWDTVVFDEAHRLTPTAQALYRLGKMLAAATPRALLMTATPHRGKEWLFRSLMHLVDPEVYEEGDASDPSPTPVRPGRIHFLRRMKEDLLDHDNQTPLFRSRRATNIPVASNRTEAAFYDEALALVDEFFPPAAAPLARMVYGKRAASSLYGLARTLQRRREAMGSAMPADAAHQADPDDDDAAARDEARVTHEQSRSPRAEREALNGILARLQSLIADPSLPVSKWPKIVSLCLEANGILPGGAEQAVVFTEYADTADWLVNRFRNAGHTAERYSGRDAHSVRDDVRERFANKAFQILVSTDAGNEGIDLQTAHVLVNWDIPWSLVCLEQRMGRIHRVGQTRDVELYNLIATDTREGEVLHVLLDSFVVAAGRLDGKLFDSLSMVAEIVGVDVEQLMARTYSGNPRDVQAALVAARAVTSARIEAAARQAAREEERLRSAVDDAAAATMQRQEVLERINPHIVEGFLARLEAAGSYRVERAAAGDGLFWLSRTDGSALGEVLGGEQRALVATSSGAITAATAAGAHVPSAIRLGPADAPFRVLVAEADEALRPALFQGGALHDPTTTTQYDLFVYEAAVSEGGGRRQSAWHCLIRVDDAGARPVRWEMLANLEAGPGAPGPPHPARRSDADSRAAGCAGEDARRREEAVGAWLLGAERELERLPTALTSSIEDPAQRRHTRERLTRAVEARLSELRSMARVQVEPPALVGWARVQPAGAPPDPTAADSEGIAMRRVAELLHSEGWAVADVHQEGRGYDLHALRGRQQRCVEVKGTWESAASVGITLTGNEILIARQLTEDYWLYVVQQCHDGAGTLFGVYQNPAAAFEGLMRDQSSVRVPGSTLRAAREGGAPA